MARWVLFTPETSILLPGKPAALCARREYQQAGGAAAATKVGGTAPVSARTVVVAPSCARSRVRTLKSETTASAVSTEGGGFRSARQISPLSACDSQQGGSITRPQGAVSSASGTVFPLCAEQVRQDESEKEAHP